MTRLTGNRILEALPDDEYALIAPALTVVDLKLGEIINQPYEPIDHAYFPLDSMISVIAGTPDGQLAEAGVVGSEGLMGVSLVLGAKTTPYENKVQIPGTGLKISAVAIREKFEECRSFRDLVLRFTHSQLIQLSQTALCNRLHSVEQRLARWLLLSRDRVDSDVLPFTQDMLSVMLGVQRPTVTTAACRLKNKGYIEYQRGQVTIRDRKRLEEFCCDCYEVVKEEYDEITNRHHSAVAK